jgi:Na+/H+ antiporter NhaD/arsenite permease-like protein
MITPHPGSILPFVLLLAAIALAPLAMASWWGRHYPKVALGLGLITLVYYVAGLRAWFRVEETALEYTSFIVLIGSLFVVSGGIHIRVKGESTPWENVRFLVLGAVLANLLGTTGASMLLIRPWLRMNKYRVTAHHVVFFIFIVSNVGGCLTPIGDPPLFLGYLQGVPFWWVVFKCWPMWATGVGILLVMFYLVDRHNYLRAPKPVREILAEPPDTWRVEGRRNVVFLAVILGAVFVNHPPFLRELLMVGAAAGSFWCTPNQIHRANDFNFHPIKEVAILFVGIFATMMPALDWLQANAASLGKPSPALFYWASGSLSSVLDNAPTYLSFLSAAYGAFISPEVITQVQSLMHSGGTDLVVGGITGPVAEQVRTTIQALQNYHGAALASGTVGVNEIETAFLLGHPRLNLFIVAISVGAVFFGANTYIGNGPNFMVKAIADQQKVRTPTFLGYVGRYTLPYMLPMLVLVWWLFFRG